MERLRSYCYFECFADRASEQFESFMSSDSRATNLKSQYSFHAVKGGANGGVDKRIVEVFFGCRPFDKVTMIATGGEGIPRPRETLLSEQGACLRYERVDDGSVLCVLYPARTENLRQEEDFIQLSFRRNAKSLSRNWLIKRDWRVFLSYMISTSLDAYPRPTDRARIWWLRLTRKRGVQGQVERPRIATGAERIFSYVVTVGLSGFLLAILVHYFGL